jgi:hypothetical protein
MKKKTKIIIAVIQWILVLVAALLLYLNIKELIVFFLPSYILLALALPVYIGVMALLFVLNIMFTVLLFKGKGLFKQDRV